MQVVETRNQIDANIRQLQAYLESLDRNEVEFARSLIRNGRCFVVASEGDGLFFAPSRFIGYRGNTMAAHTTNDDKDGKETNPAISAILNCTLVESSQFEEAYRHFCERVGVDYRDLADSKICRRYWPSN